LLPRCGKGTLGMRLIFALSAQKSTAFLEVPLLERGSTATNVAYQV
jgi:hypothetical protein